MVCPHYYAYGGVEKWSHFGAKKIPANTDLEFKLEVLECEENIDALNERNQLSNNKAPLIEKQSEWAAAEPIVGSGLIYDPDAVANAALRKASKLAGSTCAKERSKQLKEIHDSEKLLQTLKNTAKKQTKTLKKL
jgi:hypothetical protein